MRWGRGKSDQPSSATTAQNAVPISENSDVRRDFVTNVSHELKTPISAIRTLNDAILIAAKGTEAEKFAVMMKSEVERLSTLVQEIIDLSKLQDAQPLMEDITVDIDEVIQVAIAQNQVLAEEADISLIREGRLELSVQGDRNYLIIAISNLIENAIHYSSPRTRVFVSLSRESSNAVITVKDQGIGIPESELERIFERFYRIDPARSRITGGNGLGLAIVKHVIASHGGSVSVESEMGIGTTFTLTLPEVDA